MLTHGREPLIKQIRLTWWRDSLEKLDQAPPPQEPVLRALADHVVPAGITGADLARMEAGWTAILGDDPIAPDQLDLYAARRGGLMFRFSAQLLGRSSERVESAGEAWALVDLARHSSEPHDVEAALAAARTRSPPRHWPRSLRPLGMLAALAQRDLKRGRDRWEEPGAPPRAARMLRHRLTGW